MAVCVNKKILLVDDDPKIIGLLKNILKDNHFDIETANASKEAISKLKKIQYSLVITDIKMPGKYDGIDVLKTTKKISPETDVIMITGCASIEDAVKSIKLGAYDYIVKPFDMNEFLLKVTHVLKQQVLMVESDQTHESIQYIEESANKNIGALEYRLDQCEKQISGIKKIIKNTMRNAIKDSTCFKACKKIKSILK